MKRDEKIDIVRGLSMILIVLGHAGFPMKSYIYLFHVAVFFIIAGWCWKDCYSDGIKELKVFLKRRVYSLYLPYVMWLSLFTVLHNFFVRINFYTDNKLFLEGDFGNSFGLVYCYERQDYLRQGLKNLLFLGDEQLAGASWFLRCLFCVSVLWTILDFIIKKIFPAHKHILRLGIAITFLGIGNYFRTNGIFVYGNVTTVFSVYILFGIGFYHKYLHDKLLKNVLPKMKGQLAHVSGCLLLLAWMNKKGTIELSMNSYESVIFMVAASLLGWVMLLEIATLLQKYRIKKLFIYIGKNTICILFLHFFVFKTINVLQTMIYHLPKYRIAGYPTLRTDGYWWVIYTVAGIVIPLFFNMLVKEIIDRVRDK